MAHVRVANRKGTAADLADHASGYVASGEGEHSRRVASGASYRVVESVPPEQPPRWRSTATLIEKVSKELKRVEAELATGDIGHGRRARLESDRGIKVRFLDKLRAEQRGQR